MSSRGRSGTRPRCPSLDLQPTRAIRIGELATLGAIMVALAIRFSRLPAVDFPVFHRTGRLFLSGADLYRGDWEYPYRYAPGVAALFAPLGRLSLPAARAAWALASAGLAWSVAVMLSPHRRRASAVPLAWLCLFQPLAQENQSLWSVGGLLLAIVLVGWSASRRRPYASAGPVGEPVGHGPAIRGTRR